MMATESLGRRRVCPRRRPSREWLGLCGSDGVDDAGGCGGVVVMMWTLGLWWRV